MTRLLTAVLCCAFAPAVALTQVDGSGTTNPSKFFWKIMQTIEACEPKREAASEQPLLQTPKNQRTQIQPPTLSYETNSSFT